MYRSCGVDGIRISVFFSSQNLHLFLEGQQYPGSPNSYDLLPTSTPLQVAPLRFNVTASQAATKPSPRGIKTLSFRCACPKAPEKESVACQVERSVKDASTNTDMPAQAISSGTSTEQPNVKVAGTNTEQPDVKAAGTNTEISIPGVLLEWPPYTKCVGILSLINTCAVFI